MSEILLTILALCSVSLTNIKEIEKCQLKMQRCVERKEGFYQKNLWKCNMERVKK
jgi:hypothetical protein